MARDILGLDSSEVFRVTIQHRNGVTRVLGPYRSLAAAKGQLTAQMNMYVDFDDEGRVSGTRVTGFIEKASTVWERVDA